jgi:pyridoxamine 5'-phosphate oxidase
VSCRAACRSSPARSRRSTPPGPRPIRTTCSPPGSAAADRTIRTEPGTVCAEHTLYALTAVSAEFWQGDTDRRHIRLRYRRDGASWTKDLLWP